jgi:ABC-2 type transport system ATP-binding protein
MESVDPTFAISVEDLRLRYGTRAALDGVSFTVEAGEVVGLLGPNGAGKTSTLSILATLRRPSAGTAAVAGHAVDREPAQARRALGLVPQQVALYPTLTARENLHFFVRLLGLSRRDASAAIERALDVAGLAERADDIVSTFSGGMQRRLNLACALLHTPRVLLLDEPTVGVDPQSRNAIFDNLAELRRRGKTLVYTTHYMEEAERLCDRIVVMDHGRIMADDTLAGLLARAPAPNVLLVDLAGVPSEALAGRLRGIAGVHGVTADGERLSLGVDDLLDTTPRVLQSIAAEGLAVRGFASERANLEAVFLSLTGRSLRDE